MPFLSDKTLSGERLIHDRMNYVHLAPRNSHPTIVDMWHFGSVLVLIDIFDSGYVGVRLLHRSRSVKKVDEGRLFDFYVLRF